MANYRMELDALNALIDEQRRTNELLEQLIPKTPKTMASRPVNTPKKRGPRGKNQ